MKKNQEQKLTELACKLLEVEPEELFVKFRVRSRAGWYLEYQKPRYPGDIGESLGTRFENPEAKLKQLIGEPC